ncbi:MAG: peptidoglycan DD-metalloendopeptidase family protein [Chitinophagales bacterium]|nr:peptidoglycan DD-metalloendopeptidase family protein [Chitinophagales bacterium]
MIRKKRTWNWLIGGMVLLLGLAVYFAFFDSGADYREFELLEEQQLKSEAEILFGISTEHFRVIKDEVKPNENISLMLARNGVSPELATAMVQKCKEVFDMRSLRSGRPYLILEHKDEFAPRDSARTPIGYFIYEHSLVEYVVFDFIKDTVYKGVKEVTTERKTAVGTIESSLTETLEKANANTMLTLNLSDVFAWTIDFYRLQKGDKFKVIYTESFVEGKTIGVDRIEAAIFTHKGKDYYAYYFEQDSVGEYFDEKGESLKKLFLKAPLKFSRITSRYSANRFHPVLKRMKAHLGTDYAAPTGTPIMTVGNGTVLEARYTANNGYYVKVKHNATYTTQYLHMSRINKGIRPGVKVSQGDVIGFVGSTGLATGPHVCFRFWVNGKQEDPLKVKVMGGDPVKQKNKAGFLAVVQKLQPELAAL